MYGIQSVNVNRKPSCGESTRWGSIRPPRSPSSSNVKFVLTPYLTMMEQEFRIIMGDDKVTAFRKSRTSCAITTTNKYIQYVLVCLDYWGLPWNVFTKMHCPSESHVFSFGTCTFIVCTVWAYIVQCVILLLFEANIHSNIIQKRTF